MRSPFPAELKRDEPSSAIYDEFADGVARRSFEVFPDHTEVGPYDCGIPEVDAGFVLRAAREGVDPDGVPFDPRLRPVVISHAKFEAMWEQYALPRLRVLAGCAPQ